MFFQVLSFLQVSPKPCIHLFSAIRATWPSHLILIDSIPRKILREEYRSLSSSLYSAHHSLVTSSLLGPNILHSALFSITLSLRSFLNISDQVSHPYKTTSTILVLYITTLPNITALNILVSHNYFHLNTN